MGEGLTTVEGLRVRALIQKAIAAEPECARGHALLALAMHYLGKKDEALESLRKAQGIDPKLDMVRWVEMNIIPGNRR